MADLCQQVSLILNVTGPYRFFGEPVVKACVENGADYLDITGEPEFIERMILKYGPAARTNGVVAVTTCGFDSVPCDLGVEYTLSQFPDRSLVSSVESYLTIHSEGRIKGHYATFESAVHGFGNQAELSRIRKELAQREAAQGWLPRLPTLGPRLRMPSGPVLHPQLKKWILPFPGADASVVRRTQRELYHRQQIAPIQFAAYMTVQTTFYVGVVMAVGIVFKCLASYKWGRQLLLKFPRLFSWGVFSHEGPNAHDLATTTFDMQFIARAYSSRQAADAAGQPDVSVTARVAGPEAGYVATPIILVQAAMTVLEERAKIEPGLLTPALAFRQTTFQSRMQARGIQFSVLQKSL